MVVAATGFFDGVHLGHRFLVDRLVAVAKERGMESMIITFWPHPRAVLQNDARSLRLLNSIDEKKSLLFDAGVDRVEVVPFSRHFASLTAEEYLAEYVRDKFSGQCLLAGYDNRLGSDGAGTSEIIEAGRRVGVDVEVLPPWHSSEGTVVSSTKIRNALAEGDVQAASGMLGYDYMLHGVVVAGNRLGRTIGFPTANMQLYEPLKMVPGRGVYLVRVKVPDGVYMGMCNIGVRPTVSESSAVTIETNIFGFDSDIYGLDIEVSFLRKVRDERKFPDIASLKKQLEIDRNYCLSLY